MIISEAEAANITRWNGKPGYYEVYYIKFNHTESSTAYWLRYTLLASLKGNTVAELWGTFFDSRNPLNNIAIKNTFSISDAVIKKDSFLLRIKDALIFQTGAEGEIKGAKDTIKWDIRFEPLFQIFHHFPHKLMYRTGIAKTKVLSPNFSIKVHGMVEVNGKSYYCNGEPGQQTHLWGTKHADEWTWANSNMFIEDKDAIFEGISARIRIRNKLSPELTLFFIRCFNRDYYLNGIIQLFKNKSSSTFPVWRFLSKIGRIRFRGEISAGIESFVGAEYTDPDGEKLWCSNTEVADLKIDMFEDDKKLITLTSRGSCALEFVSRINDHRIPVTL